MRFRALAFLFAVANIPAHADPLATPAMTGPLAANPNPLSFDTQILGTWYVTGMASGLAFTQSNEQRLFVGDESSAADLSNAQVGVQKTDGVFQFYVQAGAYSLPAVGAPYLKATYNTTDTFGVVPLAYVKIAPMDNVSIMAGKLPTLIGAEYTFTTENMNIERGLLWYQEPAISRGVQVNYAAGPISMSVSLNDGYYSDTYNTLSGLVSYAIDGSNTVAFAASGNLSKTTTSSFTTPYNLSNGEIFNVLYTWNAAPWLINPYVQYQRVDANAALGLAEGDAWGIGLLASYKVSPAFSVAGRVEYETSSGSDSLLIYGPGSKAWSATVTPIWQHDLLFVRGDLSYVGLGDQTFGFGKSFTKDSQVRAMIEAGIVF